MKFKYPQFFVLLLFLLPMLACNRLFGDADESPDPRQRQPQSRMVPWRLWRVPPTQTAKIQITVTQRPSTDVQQANDSNSAPVSTSIQPSLAINTDALPFQTYRMIMEFAATSGGAMSSMQMQVQQDIPNQAISYQVTASGIPDTDEMGGDTMNFVVTDGTAYMPFDGECMAMSTGEGNPLDQFLNGNNEFLDDEDLQVNFQGDETLIGLPVKVYTVTGFNDAEYSNVNGTSMFTVQPMGARSLSRPK